MKNFILFIFVFFSCTAFSQSGSYTVSGNLPGLDTDTMNLDFKNDKGERTWRKIPVKDGAFSFTDNISGMQMMTIWPQVEKTIKRAGNGTFPAKSSQFKFVAFPGANIKFTGEVTDFVNAYPTGDKINDDLAEINSSIHPLLNESVNISVKLANKIITDPEEIEKARRKANQLDDEVTKKKLDFISSHPSSPVSAWYLEDMMIRSEVPNDMAEELYDKLDKQSLRDNPFFAKVVQRVEGIRSTATGKAAPAIKSVHTYDRKPFDLASLKGKYVVLDFWGTWCGPCISGMPKMKECLDKYKEKMEIVGIAQESDDGTMWRNFLDKNTEYHWYQVLNRADEDFVLKYNVAGFPTKIIVDEAGEIVARFVGEDDGIYNKLDEILK